MNTIKTPVIFRKWKNGDILALFPTTAGTNDSDTCDSYEHVGQHGSASIWLAQVTVPASPSEYRALKRELESIGYCLTIRKRFYPGDRRKRENEINRIPIKS